MSGRSGGGRGRGRGGGRGEYYKNKYGGGGRGRGGRGRGRGGNGGDTQNQNNNNAQRSGGNNGGTYQDLVSTLTSIDNKSYPAYHDIESSTRGWIAHSPVPFAVYIGRAQSDPYAPPTRCRIVVPSTSAQFPPQLYQTKERAIALADYINRAFYATCQSVGADQSAGGGGGGWNGPKGGDINIKQPSQHVLEQSAVSVSSKGDVTAQFTVNLPARGRTILGWKAIKIFEQVVPMFVQKSLMYAALNATKLQYHVFSIEDQRWLRNQLSTNGLIAFVPNNAVLPRATGADDRPMQGTEVVKFESPDSLSVEFVLPNLKKSIKGMGIRKGITLIVGGGFHGKSTLLSSLQYGVYDKIPGDGREFCVCDVTAAKIRAEDGRSVSSVDITPFITNLPFGKLTNDFTSMDASGSTSQASNIMEALEVGCNTLLVDEDTCATNFMIRDEKMIELVAPDKEPITPFVKKVRSLYEDKGVSSILVIGGSGDYFEVADTVVMMDSYKCLDVTDRAKEIVTKWSSASTCSSTNHVAMKGPFGSVVQRYPQGKAFIASNKVSVRSKTDVSYGDVQLDLSGLEQIVTETQTQSLSMILRMMPTLAANNAVSINDVLSTLEKRIDSGGLDELNQGAFNGGLARPRPFEIAGAINRLRSSSKSITQK